MGLPRAAALGRGPFPSVWYNRGCVRATTDPNLGISVDVRRPVLQQRRVGSAGPAGGPVSQEAPTPPVSTQGQKRVGKAAPVMPWQSLCVRLRPIGLDICGAEGQVAPS